MRVRFLLFLLLFAFIEYCFIKDYYEPQILELTDKIEKINAIKVKQDESIIKLISITNGQEKIIYNYEIIIRKYQKQLYYRDILNKRALYEPK